MSNSSNPVIKIARRKLFRPVLTQLKQGITPSKLALSAALGLALGIFPILGSTTLLCALAAVLLRLNLPFIQLINYVAYPLQFLLLIPLIRIGEWIFQADPISLSVAEILDLAQADLIHAIELLWRAALHAVVAWALLAPFGIFLLYLAFRLALARYADNSNSAS